ncbi:MAG: PrsW family intramembrane metalloprotease, partial [Propionibacteriaceae bacterium]|nr:PrsW family intramembrane metalloprotease [Propionibacteriaceae bacterium]
MDRGAALQALGDPRTTGNVLADIASVYPDLRAYVAQHPNAYPGLLEWLAGLGDPHLTWTVQSVRAHRASPGGYPVPVAPAPHPAALKEGYPSPYPYPGVYPPGKTGVQKAFDAMTGFEGKPIVRFRDLFRDTFRRHSRTDMEALLVAGTRAALNDRQWRLPWLYSRVFGVLIATYGLLWLCMIIFRDTSGYVVPGVVFTGALAMPATIMVFFWELNQAKNVSFFDVVRIFFIGGAMSILLTFVVSAATDLLHTSDSYGVGAAFVEATFVGFTEELAKAVAVFVLIRKMYGALISNGLLVGAVVGTGFAVFETMGYGTAGWLNNDLEWTLLIRGVLSVGGHVVWTAIAGAAFMVAQPRGAMQISLGTMAWGRFLALFAVPFGLHALWDFVAYTVVSDAVAYLLMAGLIVVAWVFVVRRINSGLRQYAAL